MSVKIGLLNGKTCLNVSIARVPGKRIDRNHFPGGKTNRQESLPDRQKSIPGHLDEETHSLASITHFDSVAGRACTLLDILHVSDPVSSVGRVLALKARGPGEVPEPRTVCMFLSPYDIDYK